MITLTPDECRVLGVLVEKAQTTPQQYPLTLNALVLGCNQKNNRHPVVEWDEERVLDAVDGLRGKGLVREAMLSGSRVTKYRHIARETLEIDTPQLVVLAELLLRGPQSIGDVRGHASRMHPLESIDSTLSVLQGLAGRAEPMVKEIPPPPGSRARLWVQQLCPDAHPISGEGGSASSGAAEAEHAGSGGSLATRVERLEAEVSELRALLARLSTAR